MGYDAIGNITSKSDVGSYTYHATKKHAVTAAGSNSYGYDLNGNMNARNGASIAWTSYNLPSQINQTGGNVSTFSYGSSRQRFKQVNVNGSTTETTIYVAGLLEKVTVGSVTAYKHYVQGATGTAATHIRSSTGTNSTYYALKDHLGSTDRITNSAGSVVVALSYDAFGKRRGSNWTGTPSSGDLSNIAATTRHGFTAHEHLDNLALIHMNGRVQDPVIGRFLSADPFVPAPFDPQSFNRFSYVRNNMLTLTDPSGFRDAPAEWVCIYDCTAIGTVAISDAAAQALFASAQAAPAAGFGADFWSEVTSAGTSSSSPLGGPPSGNIPRLVIGFRGAGLGFANLEGDTPSLAAFVEELGGTLYEHGPFSRAAALRAARDFAAANPNGQIVLTGYSRGGRSAFIVANSLGDSGVAVEVLILFDPHDVNDSVLQLEHGNVGNALNFYQQNPTTSVLGGNPFSGRPLAPYMVGSPNHRRFTPTVIGGYNYTGELGVSHLNIVSTSLRRYEELIREALGQ